MYAKLAGYHSNKDELTIANITLRSPDEVRIFYTCTNILSSLTHTHTHTLSHASLYLLTVSSWMVVWLNIKVDAPLRVVKSVWTVRVESQTMSSLIGRVLARWPSLDHSQTGRK